MLSRKQVERVLLELYHRSDQAEASLDEIRNRYEELECKLEYAKTEGNEESIAFYEELVEEYKGFTKSKEDQLNSVLILMDEILGALAKGD